MATTPFLTATTPSELTALLSTHPLALVHCHATWAAPSLQICTILETVQRQFPTITMIQILPETYASLKSHLALATVPTMIYYAHRRPVRRETGTPENVYQSLTYLANCSNAELLDAAITHVVSASPVFLAMKGVPETPKCGFSRQAVAILRENGVVFKTLDILADPDLRERIKVLYEWPTFPMVFGGGELMGGLDVMKQLADTGGLIKEIESMINKTEGEEGDEKGTQEANGTPSQRVKPMAVPPISAQPQVVEEPVEETIEETAEEAVGADGLTGSVRTRIETLVKQQQVMLFMKGNPSEPRCGFSRKIVDLLEKQEIQYGHFDILEDNVVRQGLKKYAQWPTYPQLWGKGELVGGLDVCVSLGAGLGTELGLDD